MIKSQHYPTLEQCEKFKKERLFASSIDTPTTEKVYYHDRIIIAEELDDIGENVIGPQFKAFPCPSAMEMLGIINKANETEMYNAFITLGWNRGSIREVMLKVEDPIFLANLLLILKEQGHI